MPKAFIEYARKETITNHSVLSDNTLERRSGEWLASSLSRKSPGRALYLGKFLNPSFVSGSYAQFISTGTWDEIDIVFWKAQHQKSFQDYPNLHFPDATSAHLEPLRKNSYDVICIDDLYTYLTPIERIDLTNHLLSTLSPNGKIHIANRHIMRDDNSNIPKNWLTSGDYFQDSFYDVSPEDILATFSPALSPLSIERAFFDPLLHYSERLANIDHFPHLQALFSAIFFISIAPA